MNTPCDYGECPYDAEYSEHCRVYCGLGVDEDSYDEQKGIREMKFKTFIDMYDNWNGTTCVNDDNLNCIVEGNTYDIANRKDLHDRYVVAFGFYDNTLTVRIK